MNKAWLLAVACLCFTVPAMAESLGEKTGVNSTLGVSPSTRDFVQQAAMSDMYEIQSSQLAVTKLDGADKAFAQNMIADHTKTSNELKGLMQTGVVKETPPMALDAAHQKMLDNLAKLNGADFAKQYRSEQVSAHKDAVSLFERYAKGGDNAQLKAWAAKTLPALQHHLTMAQGMNK